MMTTLGCMKAYLSRVIFAGLLGGIALGGATLLEAGLVFAGDTTSPLTSETNANEDPVPNATYDDSQPGADDPRVKEGFAAYKAGDFKQAYDIWLPLAEAGNAEAQFRVGRLYDRGEGKPLDSAKAAMYWKMSARQGHLIGVTSLGVLFDLGDGVERDHERAFKLYEYAALRCEPIAQYNLGSLILRSPKKIRDNVLGHMWLEIAALLGYLRASDVSKKLVGIITTPLEYKIAKEKAQEWLSNHSCAST